MYGTKSYDEAVELAERASRLGWVPSFIADNDKELVRYEVRAHDWAVTGKPVAWGVYPRWQYAAHRGDGADLFGGPFVVLDQLRALGEEA